MPGPRSPLPAEQAGDATVGDTRPPAWALFEELTDVGTWMLDGIAGWVQWSPMMSRLCGWPADAPAPSSGQYIDLVLAEDRPGLEAAFAELFRMGGQFDYEHRLLVHGEVRVLRARAIAECDDSGNVVRVWGATQDITGLRRVQDQLAAERDASRVLLAAMADGYAYTEAGTIREVNDAFCRLTGFDREELIGSVGPYPFWPADGVDAAAALVHQVRDQGGGEVEMEFCRKDGSRFIAASTALPVSSLTRAPHHAGSPNAPLGYVTVVRDVTAARAERQQLIDTQRTLVQAQAQAKLGSWTIDVESGLARFSAQMLALCGLADDAPAPTLHEFLALVHPDDRRDYQLLIWQVLREADYQTVQHRLVLPDGTVRHLYGTASVERDPLTRHARCASMAAPKTSPTESNVNRLWLPAKNASAPHWFIARSGCRWSGSTDSGWKSTTRSRRCSATAAKPCYS